MNENGSSSGLPPDPRERRIAERLATVGPGPAAYFDDACRLVREGTTFKATTHLVAHLLREIEGSVLNLLVPADLFGRNEQAGAHKKKVLAAIAFLGLEEKSDVAQAWLQRLDGTDAFHRRAHRNALDRPRPVDDEFEKQWTIDLWLLDEALDRLEGRYLEIHKRIDEIVTTAGDLTKELLGRAKEHVPNSLLSRRYFFQRLADEKRWRWITPLVDNGWFSDPPAAIRVEEDRSTLYPEWPPATFLSRIAAEGDAHRAVARAITAVPDIDNTTVYGELLAALGSASWALSVPIFGGTSRPTRHW